jgi:hypothetical protein
MLLPLAHSVAPHAGETLAAWQALLIAGAAGLLPFLAGLFVGDGSRRTEAAGGLAAGFVLFLLLDFAALTGSLGMGVPNLPLRAGLLIAFLAGLLLPARTRIPIAWVWVAGVALHSLG